MTASPLAFLNTSCPRRAVPPGRPAAPLRPLLWTAAWTLLAAQALAFHVLCAHQVQRAEARRQLSQVQERAFRDCLAYVQGSTIASCGRVMRGLH